MKVRYNRGADLMTCLSAVKTGSTDCEQGLVAKVQTFTELGVSETSVFPMDGAGSNDQGRSSPVALASFYRAATQTPYAQTLFDSLPVLGKSGTIANVLTDAPVAVHVQVKTGNRVVGTPADQTICSATALPAISRPRAARNSPS
jgi:serine-type D-Ala-D-Ala carboxypeptidase/endopeptidase (penicillin-binding protein 4)